MLKKWTVGVALLLVTVVVAVVHLNNQEKIEELFQLIGNRNDIFYGTNAEVLL